MLRRNHYDYGKRILTLNRQIPSTVDPMSILLKLLDYMKRIKHENNISLLQKILEELNQDDDINNYIALLSRHPAAVNDTEKLILNTRNTIIDQLKETSMCKGLHDAVTDLTCANSTSRNNKQPDSNDKNTINLEKQAVWFDWSVLTRYSAST